MSKADMLQLGAYTERYGIGPFFFGLERAKGQFLNVKPELVVSLTHHKRLFSHRSAFPPAPLKKFMKKVLHMELMVALNYGFDSPISNNEIIKSTISISRCKKLNKLTSLSLKLSLPTSLSAWSASLARSCFLPVLTT
jgi:hypothetical protein